MASPVADSYSSAAGDPIYGGRYNLPSWAPAPGELKTISHSAGYFGTNGGATLGEIDPIYQTWHPAYGSGNSFSLPFGIPASAAWGSINAYCGMAFNPDKRKYCGFGAGHSAINVSAPYGFDLTELRWMWEDVPLPFDGYTSTGGESWPLTDAAVAAHYTNGELDYTWGEIQGGSTSWGPLSQPGKIQPIPGHCRAAHICIPAAKWGNASGVFIKSDNPTGKTGGVLYPSSHAFDFDSKAWSRLTNKPPVLGGDSGYDPVSNKLIKFGKGNTFSSSFAILDIPTKTWSQRDSTNTKQTATDNGGCLVHTNARLYIVPASRTSGDAPSDPGSAPGVKYAFFAVKIDELNGAGAFSIATLTVNVVSTWPLNTSGNNNYMGWSYCPLDKCIYCTSSANGSAKYWRLSPPVGAVTADQHIAGTWTLSELTFTTGAFIHTLATLNQYNRNQWDAASKSFIWHSGGLNDPVMSWRPELI